MLLSWISHLLNECLRMKPTPGWRCCCANMEVLMSAPCDTTNVLPCGIRKCDVFLRHCCITTGIFTRDLSRIIEQRHLSSVSRGDRVNVSSKQAFKVTLTKLTHISAGDSRSRSCNHARAAVQLACLCCCSPIPHTLLKTVTVQQEAKRMSVCVCNKIGDLLMD